MTYQLTDTDLTAFRNLVSDLQTSLLDRADADDDVAADLRTRFDERKEKNRTADSYTEWRERFTEQVAVAWVLTAIFVRYMEDNGLVDEIRIAGTGDADAEVEDRWRAFIADREAPTETDYLLYIFRRLGELRAGGLFRPGRNDLYKMKLPGDAGRNLLKFFRQTDPDTGELVYDFTTDGSDTRFLGDLYQDLSQDARKRYALLQTPDFVEEFILDKTLEPAIETFGLDEVRFIDPTCGSGHFLLGGFRRILRRLAAKRPGMERAKRVRRALDATHGVDINPFAVSIARFRLLVAAIHEVANGEHDLLLKNAPNLPLKIATGDSLLLGRQFPRWEKDIDEILGNQQNLFQYTVEVKGETTEDYDLIYGARAASPQNTSSPRGEVAGATAEVDGGNPAPSTKHPAPAGQAGILMQQYHAVVGNPPYITVKDKAAGKNYRKHYESCYYQYSLVCPFYERFFDLAGGAKLGEQFELGADPEDGWPHTEAGYVGMIVGNAFMKRTFGQKLIEEIIPHTDLTHVIDTSGAYIPGHGTPTIILNGRNRDPQAAEVRAALGIRGEPEVPDDAAEAKVWTSIRDHIDEEDFENDFITISDIDREIFHEHPWSLRGGGVLEAKAVVEEAAVQLLEGIQDDLGRTTHTGEDNAFFHSKILFIRSDIPMSRFIPLVRGEDSRDWLLQKGRQTYFPYQPTNGEKLNVISEDEKKFLWPMKPRLAGRIDYGRTLEERELDWWDHSMFFADRFRVAFSLTFAFVATHNHFVLDRGGKVFNRSAPVIKLPKDATEEDHLELLGPLNSSTGCFWMKQVFHNKHGSGDGKGMQEPWMDRYELDGTKMKLFPLPEERPVELPRRLDALGQRMADLQPREIAEMDIPTPQRLDEAREERNRVLAEMIALQEELDWCFYEIYGLLDEAPKAEDFYKKGGPRTAYDALPEVRDGERAFEITLARKMEAGDFHTRWFEMHNRTYTTEIPDRWPDWYRQLIQARLDAIENERFVRLIEAPEFKRRWNLDDWEDLERKALENWLKSRLETARYIPQAPDAVTLTQAAKPEDEAPGGLGPRASSRVVQRDEESHGSSARGTDTANQNRTEVDPTLTTVAKLAHKAREDEHFQQVARRLTGDPAVDIEKLVTDLVTESSVPYLPAQRYKKSGLQRRREWEKVWDLQRIEDGTPTAAELFNHTPDHLQEVLDKLEELYGEPRTPPSPRGEVAERSEADGGKPNTQYPTPNTSERSELNIPKPPKYRKSNYQSGAYYYLRGKLDVPKERFTCYPGLEGEDGSLVISWAGLDHLQRAKALATFYYKARNQRGWGPDRLVPILAGLKDLLPWVNQWHPEPDPRTGEPFGVFLKNMIVSQAQTIGVVFQNLEKSRIN